MKDNIDWNECPPEILSMIFKHLDTKALTKCMLVNKKWKDIAEHTAEYYTLWEDIVKTEMTNKGASFINKSTLDWKNIFKNSMLWNHVKNTNIKCLKTYEIQGVKKMNVYKDNLILINNSHVMYYDIKTFTLLRSFESSCLNFEENDHMIVECYNAKYLAPKLFLYIKLDIDHFNMDSSTRHVIKDIRLYRLESKWCYVLTNTNILWAVAHEVSQWKIEYLGRHYGSDYDPVTAIHVYNDLLYIVTKWGTVWYGDTQHARFRKVYKLQIPQNISHRYCVMFDNFNCVIPVTTNNNERVRVNYDAKSNVIMLECSELTCALQHGDVLFLGYSDGRVEIRVPKINNGSIRKDPDRYFNIQQFYKHVDDSTIVGLNVFEAENSHNLLVNTRGHVFQLELTYPDILL